MPPASDFPRDLSVQMPSGLRLAYRDWGGAGLPVVLLHGLASSYRIWDLVAPLLASEHHVVALDQRGHGRSDRPDTSFEMATYAADLRGFLASLDLGRVVLVGHSWGGNVALQFTVEEPELVASLVLMDGGFLELSSRPGWTWERAAQELAPPQLDGITNEELMNRVSQGNLARVWSPAVAETVLGHFEELPGGRLRPWLRREHHMRIVRALWDHQPSLLWGQVRCPVLLIPARQPNPTGRQAELQPAKATAVAIAEERLACSQTLWMDDTIHDVPLQRPTELAAAIRAFVSGLTNDEGRATNSAP